MEGFEDFEQTFQQSAPVDNGLDGLAAGQAPQEEPQDEGPPDARIAWRAENATMLAKKDEDEQVAKKEVEAAAQAYLSDFYEKRDAHVERQKKENREVQEAAKLKPTGDTAWARVMSLIDFKFDSGRQKEVERERFKNLLFTAKEKNVSVRPPFVEAEA